MESERWRRNLRGKVFHGFSGRVYTTFTVNVAHAQSGRSGATLAHNAVKPVEIGLLTAAVPSDASGSLRDARPLLGSVPANAVNGCEELVGTDARPSET